MIGKPARVAIALVIAVPTAVLAACAATSSTSGSTAWSLVALGDSVPAGTACDCTPYPQLSAPELAPSGSPATTRNDAVGGYTTVDVLDQLSGGGEVASDVAGAHVVEVQVGANDVLYSSSCGAVAACYEPQVPGVAANLRAIVERLHELGKGRTLVVLLDYWSVWLGGTYATEQGQAYVDAAATVTSQINTTIREVATETGSAYIDLRAAFKGPDYQYDETHYLASDGEHPNAAGHQQIASAVVDVVNAR
ncbi:hypothetical protein JCM18899A_40660 [Nocardioides sp. AN3]